MKVVHLCLGCFFPDNYSYQENMLPKFHKKLGYDVEVIASLMTFNKNGKATFLKKASVYSNEYEIKVTRLDYKTPKSINRKLKRYVGTYEALEEAKPNILFIHGCQFMDMSIIVDYLSKYADVKVYVDNHADFSNSASNWLSKNILHKILWKHSAHIIEPYTTKFYGVLPARVDFLTNIYDLPKEKCELLVMGADDDEVSKAKEPNVRQETRQKHDVSEDDFLIITGGKIDQWKKQTFLLMKAVANITDPKVKLIVFGSVTPELKDQMETLCLKNKVIYIGWMKAEDTYQYFSAADLVVFPGRHSVFWEQVVGQGIPMVCKKWSGTTHIDIGGNVKFLEHDSVDEIQKAVQLLLNNPLEYESMKRVANSKASEQFLYKKIAKYSIESK